MNTSCLQDRVLADGTFVPAGTTVLYEDAGSADRVRPPGTILEGQRRGSEALPNAGIEDERPAAGSGQQVQAESMPGNSGPSRTGALPTRARNSAVPPTAPMTEPVSNAQLQTLVEFMQRHR